MINNLVYNYCHFVDIVLIKLIKDDTELYVFFIDITVLFFLFLFFLEGENGTEVSIKKIIHTVLFHQNKDILFKSCTLEI